MPELRNPRHERFCQAYLETGVGSEALRRAGYRAYNVQTASADSARLLARASIKERITTLKAQQIFNSDLKREELAGYYSAVIRTPAGEVNANHPLAQSVEISDKGVKIRLPDKNQAAAGLARLHGWEAAERVDLTLDSPLTQYLRALRGNEVRVIEGDASG